MNIIGILASVNKLAIGAFVVTLAFLLWESMTLLKSRKRGKLPSIPDFVDGKSYAEKTTTQAKVKPHTPPPQASGKPKILLLLVPTGIFAIAAFVVGISVYSRQTTSVQSATRGAKVQYVSSTGIEIYDAQWNKITPSELTRVNTGDTIYVGVATIPNVQIDRARIKINEDSWTQDAETQSYNPDLKIFYKQYSVPEGSNGLKIEAELHEPEKGWLGDQ